MNRNKISTIKMLFIQTKMEIERERDGDREREREILAPELDLERSPRGGVCLA